MAIKKSKKHKLVTQKPLDKYTKWLMYFTAILAFATIVLVILGCFQYLDLKNQSNTLDTQTHIQEEQTKIQKSVSIPNAVELITKIQNPNYPDLRFEIKEITNQNDPIHINLWIINKGRLPSGPINIRWNTSWLSPNVGNRNYIRNIESGSWNYTELKLYNITEIPTGFQKLKYILDCDFCETQKDEREINITVYEYRRKCTTLNSLYGTVRYKGKLVNDVRIHLTNSNTYESINISSNSLGNYIWAVGNALDCWYIDDLIEAKACFSNKCETKKIKYAPDEIGMEVNFEIT